MSSGKPFSYYLRAVVLALAASGLIGACGSRTGLLVDLERPEVPLDASADGDSSEDAPGRPDARDGAFEVDGAEGGTDASLLVCGAATCASQGFACGLNGDGCGNAIDCGPCPPLQVCGAKSFSKCASGPPCAPKTCQSLGFNCGPAGDGCGGALACGFCQYPDSCGSKGSGQCGNSLPCTNLCKQQIVCDAGTTTVTGTVIAGTLSQYGTPDPVYNALVYVPNGAVKAFAPGVACDHCGASVSGDLLVAANTAADGSFTLTNVPVGTNIPLVIQLGRWRRQLTIPSVAACQNTALPPTFARMPRNQSEGDIPHMAVATGNADAIECVLMKMGIDQSEFTQPGGAGRIHMYQSTGSDDGVGTPPIDALVSSASTLANYDIVLLPCESAPTPKLATDQQNLVKYADAGGRLFITHYGYEWLYNASPFSATAVFNQGQGGNPTGTGDINTAFNGGQALGLWMKAIGALSGPHVFAIKDPRFNIDSVTPPSQLFVFEANQGRRPFQYAFDAPVGKPASQQCGRVVYSSFHVASTLTNGTTFPAECTQLPLSPQEKNLEFMLFDVANCLPNTPSTCVPRDCQQQKISCGPAGDGCGVALDCGACNAPQTCGGDVPFACGVPDAGSCVPVTCQSQGFDCGANGDGCGAVIQCGTCSGVQTCGGGGKPGVCAP